MSEPNNSQVLKMLKEGGFKRVPKKQSCNQNTQGAVNAANAATQNFVRPNSF